MPLGEMYKIPLSIDTDQLWMEFAVRIVNTATFERPANERLGQRLMNALGDESPLMFEIITDTEYDIWELEVGMSPAFLGAFWQRLYELFVEFL